MKNSKGVSVISVIVTVIVIIILASITIFTGRNMLNQAKEDRAKERLEVIYQALRANESLLGIGETVDNRELEDSDYLKIGLEYYMKGNDVPTITFSKRIGSIEDATDTTRRTYTLSDGTYEKQFDYDVGTSSHSVDIAFDSVAGVNRPQLTEEMQAINFANSAAGEEVEDIYLERWYSYDSSAPNYANMKIGDTYYVWIPRYAYKIQTYYAGKTLPNIPNSAIDIIFLKGTSNLDAGGNSLPSDYEVHPAFTYGDTELAGIWVEKYHNRTSSSISDVYSSTLNSYGGDLYSHLLKNVEWSAVAYLAQTCGAATSDSSTKNNSGVMDMNDGVLEYVAAYVNYDSATLSGNGASLKNGDSENVDVYFAAGGSNTLNAINTYKYGDALVETSSGASENSAWYNSTTVVPTAAKPFIARGTGDSLFGYTSSNGAESTAYYRTAILGFGTEGSADTTEYYSVSFHSNYSVLPSGYTVLEYLATDGRAYINLGSAHPITTNTQIEVGAQFGESWIYGYTAGDSQRYGGTYQSGYMGSAYVQWTYDGKYHDYVFNYSSGVTVDGTEYIYTGTPSGSSGSANLYLFRANGSSVYVEGKIFYFKQYEDGELVYDLVPCYRASDNVSGMYDLVENTFYGNTGSGSFSKGYNSQYFIYGEDQKLLANSYNRLGYTFTGWNTQPNGSGTSYTDGQTMNIASGAANQVIDLYAQWRAATYIVTFNPGNKGSVSPTAKNVTYGGVYGDLPTPSKDGYEFKGWYTAEEGGSKVTEETKVSILSAQTLYAQWEEEDRTE
ncbi:MAG: InlB B-repeat-containing protein [Clostridia bacterium]|nr:InlB B-repeat-containing protein [Clostridia bacterium]